MTDVERPTPRLVAASLGVLAVAGSLADLVVPPVVSRGVTDASTAGPVTAVSVLGTRAVAARARAEAGTADRSP